MDEIAQPASELPAASRFLTLAETAEILHVSASQVYALLRSAELPGIKVGSRGQWRIERTILESYIQGKYEESRRRGLWNQSEFANLPEYSFESRTSFRTRD